MNYNLYSEIISLISLHQEGPYWDFKREWHKNNKDLLLDIICMTNNTSNRDAYIIIGVDEENNYSYLDVKDDSNRKNTQNITDFLKDKKFVGGIRPLVHVESLSVSKDTVIDVIVIENSDNTPYYLTDSYMGIFPYHIYSRVQDTSTPINSNADINVVEYLWKKRFHLLDSPIEKFRYYLKDIRNWVMGINDHVFYYKQEPQYVIEIVPDDRDGYEYYMFNQIDSRPRWATIQLKYFNTLLVEYNGIFLDGARGFTPAPEWGFRSGSRDERIGYNYLIKDSIRWDILEFYRCNYPGIERNVYDTFLSDILIFEDEEEYEEFKSYLNKNWNSYTCKEMFYELNVPNLKEQNIEAYKEDWANFNKTNEMLYKFRMEKLKEK